MELKHGIFPYIDFHVVLLIVPYGIETCGLLAIKPCTYLLIVPYGIETFPAVVSYPNLQSFNRTLWN